MGSVLWVNHLVDGKVVSDEIDKWALYRHAGKLDRLAVAAKLEPFSNLIDHTDILFNTSHDELPEGMESTNDLMAQQGVWATAVQALDTLTGLLATVTAEQPRFGIIANDYEAVVAELAESVESAKKARSIGARFNFAVVL